MIRLSGHLRGRGPTPGQTGDALSLLPQGSYPAYPDAGQLVPLHDRKLRDERGSCAALSAPVRIQPATSEGSVRPSGRATPASLRPPEDKRPMCSRSYNVYGAIAI
jgi:hypothetical protein